MSPTANTIYPSSGLDKRIPSFLSRFYSISGDPDTAEEYLTLFTPNASFQFLSIRLNGTEGIRTLREMMWTGNLPRQHEVKKVFAGDQELEVMMFGTVTMNLPKEKVTMTWAGHMTLEEFEGALRVKDYQVYADNSPLDQAMTRQ